MQVAVEFAQQALSSPAEPSNDTCPIPTDAYIGHARVTVTGGIARIFYPDGGLRAIGGAQSSCGRQKNPESPHASPWAAGTVDPVMQIDCSA